MLVLDKTVQEMKNFLKNNIVSTCFNESHKMVFHYLLQNYEAASFYDLTSLLGLGPKFYPQNDRISFKK